MPRDLDARLTLGQVGGAKALQTFCIHAGSGRHDVADRETDRYGDRCRGQVVGHRLAADTAQPRDVAERRRPDDQARNDQRDHDHRDESDPGRSGRLDRYQSPLEPCQAEDVGHQPGEDAENQGDRDLRIDLHGRLVDGGDTADQAGANIGLARAGR